MPIPCSFYLTLVCVFLAFLLPAGAATVNATWNTPADVPVTAASYTATGNTVNFTLNFAPATGTNLTVVNNTSLPFISGTFDNLAQGQVVTLSYNGVTYNYVAHYYGGTGNDLVLVWATNRPVAWGYNVHGELGNGLATSSGMPVGVIATGTPLGNRTLLALSAGTAHSLALCSDGTLAAWGYNSSGQLGDGTITRSGVPVAVAVTGSALAGKVVVAIAAGGVHNLVLCADGTVASWGYNANSQLGNNTILISSVPVEVPTAGTPMAGKSVAAIAAGSSHSLVLCTDGTLVGWGINSSGQLGDNSTSRGSLPVEVTTAGTPLAGKTVVSIAAGGNHNIALCSDGTLVTWGLNDSGQLGNNTTVNSKVPVAVRTAGTVLAGKTVIAVTVGYSHSLVLCSDGTLAAWGNNVNGQLGNNTITNSRVAVAVDTSGVLAGKTIVRLTAGSTYSVAQCSDGTVATWGFNASGELGDNTFFDSSIPVAVNTSSLAASERFMLISSGQSADHNLGVVASPAPVCTTLAATAVTATTVTLNGMINPNGGTTVVSFDYGLDSTYGKNVAATPAFVTGSSSTPVSATLTGLAANTTYHYRVNGGADQTFTTINGNLSALTLDAGTLSPVFSPTVYHYAAAADATVSSLIITPVTSDSSATVTINGVSSVSGGPSYPVPLSYGDNKINIVVTASDNISTVTYTLLFTRLPTLLNAAYSTASDVPVTINGLTTTGNVVNFVLNYAPAPGTILTVVNNTSSGFIKGTFSNLAHGEIVNLSYNGVTYPFVASYFGGTGNDLVLVWASMRPVSWGNNTYGPLGNNTLVSSSVPISVTTAGTPLAGSKLLGLAAGGVHSLALLSDGSLASWGDNSEGELGTQRTFDSYIPVSVITAGTPLAGKVAVAVAAGSRHNLVLCSDGTLASWGNNANGQLGNNTTTNSLEPVMVKTEGGLLASKFVVAIGAGTYHSVALCSDGSLAAWGSNGWGQLGNGSESKYSVLVPAAVAMEGKTAMSMAVGGSHNIALCSDGTLVAWGDNGYGQIGNNSSAESREPVAVTTAGTVLVGKTVIAVAAGFAHSLALCSDGTLAAWGYNGSGQLGNNTTTNSRVPVAVDTSGVMAGKTVIALTAGSSHSMVLCSDGTIIAWGNNSNGRLGNSSTVNSSVPVVVSTSSLATGERFMMTSPGGAASHTLSLVAMPVSPTVTTLAATSVMATMAVLNGTVNANGGTATMSFDYGLNNTYSTNLAGTPANVTGGITTAVSTSLTGLMPNTTYHFRANGGNGSGTSCGADLTFTTLSSLQGWRQTYFGTSASTGASADGADFDNDGIPNLLEFALNLNPTTASSLPVTSAMNGANFEYTYTRGAAAVTAGAIFTVEWSDTLAAGSWSTTGVTQTVLSDDGTTQQVKAVIPINAAKAKFVHLSISAPP